MSRARDRLIVALDVPSAEGAETLIERLGNSVGVYKIGLELLFAGGPALAAKLASRGQRVFLDAKLLDIEATVERATASVARTGAEFLTVHATDRKTLDAAVRGRGDSGLKLLGVTVLTNLGPSDLIQQGTDIPPAELASWDWANQLQFVHSLGLILIGLLLREAPGSRLLLGASLLMMAGLVLFSGSIYAEVLGAPEAVGRVAPVGGSSFMLGWLLTGIAGLRMRP